MTTEKKAVDRRSFMKGALAAAAVMPFSGVLAACAGDSGDSADDKKGGGKVSEQQPVRHGGQVDGRRGDLQRWLRHRLRRRSPPTLMEKNHAGSTVKVSPSTQIAQELQPRFVGGNPPDLIDNSGAERDRVQHDPRPARGPQRRPRRERTSRATTIRDTLFGGVEEPGTFDGKLAALNYVLTVYAVWYSASLFEENGWTPPKTWDEAIELGAKAKEKDKYLFVLGQGGGDLLPDPRDRLGDQGGRRRGPARAGEPRGGLLVASGRPGRLHGAWARSSRPAT